MRKLALLTLASGWLAFQSAQAFNPQPDPPRYGMIGITPGETLRINVANPQLPSATLPPPCRVELAFLDSAGNPLIPPVQRTLDAGRSAHFDLNGDALFTPGTGDVLLRAEVRPVVRVLQTAVGDVFVPPGPCVSSIELFDNATGKTRVSAGLQNPGVIVGFNPQPDPPRVFAQLGIVTGQTIRLNAVNVGEPGLIPPSPCRATLVLFGPEGGVLAHSTQVLQPGAATFLDFTLPPVVETPRTEIRGVVIVESISRGFPPPCRATLEVFDNVDGKTSTLLLPTSAALVSAPATATD